MTPPAPASPRIAGLLLAAGSGTRFGGPKALADTGNGPWVTRALATLESLDPRAVVVGAAADEVVALLPPDVLVVRNDDHDSGMGSSLVAGLRALFPGAGPAGRGAVDAVVVMLVDLPDVPAEAVRRVVEEVTGGVVGGVVPRGADRVTADGEAGSSAAAGDGAAADGAACGAAQAAARATAAAQAAARGAARGAAQAAARATTVAQAAARAALARAAYHGEPGHPVLIGADHVPGVLAAAGGDRGARDYLATQATRLVECGDLAAGRDVDIRPAG